MPQSCRCVMEIGESLIRMVSALAVVLSLMVMVTMIVRRLIPGQLLGRGEAPMVRILGSGHLGPRKSIFVVSVAGEVFVVGSTATHLVALGQIKNTDHVERLLAPHRREREPSRPREPTFASRRLEWLGRAFKLFEDQGVWRVSAYPPTQEEPNQLPPPPEHRADSVGATTRPNVKLPRRVPEAAVTHRPREGRAQP